MYLSDLQVEGFRCFEEMFEITFASGLNVVVGENGTGKTAIISAIRQLFHDSESGRYSVSSVDFHRTFASTSRAAEFFSIKAEFTELSSSDKISLLPWTGGTDTAALNLEVANREFRGRYRRVIWGGSSKASQFDPELLDLIHCIYLPPLRDAELKLTNGKRSRLSKLLTAVNRKTLKECSEDNRLHPLEIKLKSFNESMANDDDLSISTANTLISDHLEKAIGRNFGQSTRIQFVESNFTKIVESLTLLFFPNMDAADEELFRGLSENSLGYNNLLYVASILAELTLEESEEDNEKPIFKLLLIEEPEAHLHPQLQIRLLNHLKSVAMGNNSVQVIVTSHSTVLASAVEVDSIIHLNKANSPIATPLRLCGISATSKRFIDRWLDATKSNLLFASGVILVEGIAEQMLVPVMAKVVLNGEVEGQKSLEDQGVSTINLNGIYFKHFIGLYCNLSGIDGEKDQNGLNIPVRCSGLTDLDPPKTCEQLVDGEKTTVDIKPYEGNLFEGENHAIQLTEGIEKSENARLFVSKYKTLEYDLAMEGNNAAVMASLLAKLWPKPKSGASPVIEKLTVIAGVDWLIKTSEETADAAHEILKRIDDQNIGKGLFAQVLADKLTNQEVVITVPEYIKQAVLWSCSLENEE